ncbi:MAG: hypothetical protein M3O34_03760, partial [Chloroflexota bacterium]|nr:hypothetical protein [Chloroflexota bacterium]
AALLGAPAALPAEQGVVIAPDRAGLGTNALVLAPPAGLSPRFGVDSFRAHLTAAVERRLPYQIVERPGLALDLDTPDDIARLLASPSSGRTVVLARSLQFDERLGMAANR